MRRTITLAWICCAGACAEPEIVSIDTEPLITSSASPEVGFFDVKAIITPGVIAGWTSDEEQAASTVPVTLTSDRAGELWRGNANGGGTWSWSGELDPGEHEFTIQAVDREGNLAKESVVLNVRTNDVPQCEIIQPADGSTFTVRDAIQFEALAFDGDGDPLILLWRSTIQGALFEGASSQQRLVTPGDHLISVEAMDLVGEPCVDEVLVRIVE
ncbi:MAG: hypothetical protein ACI9MC_001843 [Kiritimatiellia bacterium]|jgi:hypothetical protein